MIRILCIHISESKWYVLQNLSGISSKVTFCFPPHITVEWNRRGLGRWGSIMLSGRTVQGNTLAKLFVVFSCEEIFSEKSKAWKAYLTGKFSAQRAFAYGSLFRTLWTSVESSTHDAVVVLPKKI